MTIAPAPPYKLLFGYKHVQGVPLCPCRDPGNYLTASQSETKPFVIEFRCWCGRTMLGEMESVEELTEFLTQNGVDLGKATIPTQTGGS